MNKSIKIIKKNINWTKKLFITFFYNFCEYLNRRKKWNQNIMKKMSTRTSKCLKHLSSKETINHQNIY